SRALGDALWDERISITQAEEAFADAARHALDAGVATVETIAEVFEDLAARCSTWPERADRAVAFVAAGLRVGLPEQHQLALEARLAGGLDAGLAVLQLDRYLRDILVSLDSIMALGTEAA